ncbi:MAG TPA: restriction endonuclease [Candidatus Paceibacterota bacterium]
MQFPEIVKQDGMREPFRPHKLLMSLIHSGAEKAIAESIVAHIESEVADGDTTSTIYKHAFSLLKKNRARIPAARYSMKRAIRELGPSGFPFEDFVAEIFKAQGYKTKTGIMMQGSCALHEVDMIAEKEGRRIGAEMKFHNNLGITSDLKVALYVDARFNDLRGHGVDEGILITNTRFTENAVQYGNCRKLKMISWSYPHEGNLQNLIEETGVQPITALPSLSKREKELLLGEGLVLCRMLSAKPAILHSIFSEKKLNDVIAESQALCTSNKKV